jgi:acetolactate synthase regulatory subunit
MRQRFRIVAVPDPQTLPRILGLFAQRSLVPATMSAQQHGDLLHIETALDDLDAPTAAIIAAKLCESVLVASAICWPTGQDSCGRDDQSGSGTGDAINA